jgi:hypothetical protein
MLDKCCIIIRLLVWEVQVKHELKVTQITGSDEPLDLDVTSVTPKGREPKVETLYSITSPQSASRGATSNWYVQPHSRLVIPTGR